MNSQEFRENGKAMVDFIADYWDSLRERQTFPSVEPGFIEHLIPTEAPQKGEDWKDIFNDINKIIIPGLNHWQSPNFHGYFPSGNSFPSILGEMLSAGFGCLGINWISSPICTELEIMMMNWLGKILNLPEEFLDCSGGNGGGVLQGTSSESILIAILAAKEKHINSLLVNSNHTRGEIQDKLVAYTSNQANCCVEKAGKISSISMKHLNSINSELRGKTLEEVIKKDKEKGLIPCIVIATLGTTGTCAFDNIEELGKICKREKIWFHVDAAYAGSVFVCPEYRYLMKGIEFADSINIALHKWMLVNFDCTAMWVKDVQYLFSILSVDRIYLKHKFAGYGRDYHNWQIHLGRRFRALKVWFVLRNYGVEGIQKHIRNHISLAQYFEKLLNDDCRFEVASARLGLVCFRIKENNSLTEKLIEIINNDKKYFLIPYQEKNRFLIRFAITSRLTNKEDVRNAWKAISSYVDDIDNESNK